MIAIKGLKMPDSCKFCPYAYERQWLVYTCTATGEMLFDIDFKRIYQPGLKHEDCPLIEIKDDITND